MLDSAIKQEMIDRLEAYAHVERATDHPHWRPHQIDTARNIVDFLRRPNDPPEVNHPKKLYDGGSIKMATGTGKTHVEMGVAHAMDVPSITVTPRLLINDHAKEVYAEKMGLSPDEVAVYDSDQTSAEKERVLQGVKHIITTPQGFATLHEKGYISPNPSNSNFRPLLQLDESDLMIGLERGELFRKYVPNCITLAYSATDAGVNRELFGGQEDRVHNLPITKAVEGDLLAKGIKTAVLDVEPDDLDIQAYIKEHQEEYPEELLEKFAKNKSVINEVIRFHETHDDNEIGRINRLPTLVTVSTIAAAKQVADEFNKYYGDGYAVAVSGDTPAEDIIDPKTEEVKEKGMKTILREHNEGSRESRVVVYPQVLGRGTDIVNSSVLISMKPLLKPNTVEQDLGRIVRKVDVDDTQYFDRYGHDKIGLAVNVRTPEIQPYLYSQVVGQPSIYSSQEPRRSKKGLPQPLGPVLPTPGKASVVSDVKELEAIYANAEAAHQKRMGVVPEGWLTLQQVASRVGIGVDEVRRRAKHILAGEEYFSNGLKPGTPGVPDAGDTMDGGALKQHFGGKIILCEDMAEQWREIQEKVDAARAGGAVSDREIAANNGTVAGRVRQVAEKIGDTSKDELPDGAEEELKQTKPEKKR